MLESLVLGALAQFMTDRAIESALSRVRSSPEERALRAAVKRAVQRVTAELGEPAGDHLKSVLDEHLSEPPSLPEDAETSVTAALSAAVDALVARLAEPSGMSGEGSYLDVIGVDRRWLARRLSAALAEAIKQVALTRPALAQLANQLNFDEIQQGQRNSLQSGPPFMVPWFPADFIERPVLGGELVRALVDAAAQSGEAIPVVVTGAGGMGKTRLVAWACHQPEVQEQFPGGVLWAELGQRPSEEDLVSKLNDLTATLTGNRPAVDKELAAANAFATALGQRQILLVVDDAWREQDIERFLARGPRCVRLVTTRRPPVVAGHEIRVDAMSASEATALLRRGLPEATTGEELAPLLERSERWPLALAFLGGTLRSRRRHGISVPDAVDDLATGLDRHGFGGLDESADSGGRRTIEATLTLSLNELEAAALATFDRYVMLAAFGGGEPVPSRLLERLWGVSAVGMRTECGRFLDRSLVVSANADGVRLHDVVRDELRRRYPGRVKDTSQALLDTCRPADGWHTLPNDDQLWPRLAYHLVQAERATELGELLRDFRYLVARLDHGGPLAVESDLQAYQTTCAQDAYAGGLATILRQEVHLLDKEPIAALTTDVIGDVSLFEKHPTVADLMLTLYSRLAGNPDVLNQIRHAAEALPRHALLPVHPLADRGDPRLLRVLTGHRHYFAPWIAWMPDGRLASVSGGDHTMRVWDTKTGEQESVIPVPMDYVLAASLSPDGRYLAVVGRDKSAGPEEHGIRVVEVATGTIAAERSGLPGLSSGVCWGANSATLAVAHPGGVELWQPFSGAAPRVLDVGRDGGGGARVAVWHPQAGLACVTFDGWLVTWPDPAVGHAGDVWDLGLDLSPYGRCELAWRPDGRQLSIAIGSEFLVVEPARRGVVQRTATYCAYEHAWRPDGTALAVGDLDSEGGRITIWRQPREQVPNPGVTPYMPDGAPIFESAAHMIWHPTDEVLVVTTAGRPIQLWRPMAAPGPVTKPRKFESVSWQPGGERLALVGDKRGLLEIVDCAEPGKALWTASAGREYWGDPVAWSPDGRFLADDNYDSIRIRSAATGEVLRELPIDDADRLLPYVSSRPTVVGWPTPRSLVMASGANVTLVDAEDGREQARIRIRGAGGHTTNVLALSGDGSKLAVLRNFRDLIIIEMPGGTPRKVDESRSWLHYGNLGTFLPGATRLLTTSGGRLSLWDISTRKIVAQATWEMPYGVAADPTGTYVAAVAWHSHQVALFDALTLERVCQLTVDGPLQRCAFDSTGERLAAVGLAGAYIFRVKRGMWPL